MSFKEVSLVCSTISKTKIKKLDGISKTSESIRTYLIGQIGKNYAVESNPIRLQDILDEVYAIIDQAKDLVGGRTVILECERSEELIGYYRRHDFDVLLDDESESLVTLYTCIV